MPHLSNSAINLIPAGQFTIDELTEIYNQTRVDYLVPMPMNAARLAKYVQDYDVDLARSFVAVENGHLRGVAMLGVRNERTWITRLGVIPSTRRGGVGPESDAMKRKYAEYLGLSITRLNNDDSYRQKAIEAAREDNIIEVGS